MSKTLNVCCGVACVSGSLQRLTSTIGQLQRYAERSSGLAQQATSARIPGSDYCLFHTRVPILRVETSPPAQKKGNIKETPFPRNL
ncbi:hypothetical protein BJY04DRAFT_186017 [Aspergillus karnatakaensis]|uniref:uncharacterized protein n=1 Tax=Aspergillus karnatakaensis TaxID=1810916 RepID=UPI003CCCEFF8